MKRILLLFMALHLCGCALVRGTEIAGIRTFDGLSATYPADARQLAIQAALELSRRYPAGQTDVALVSVPGEFGTSLEEELRVFGFALLPVSSADRTLHIGYVIDEISEERMPTGYLQIRTSDGTLFSIIRQLKGGLLPPTLSIATSPVFAAPETAPPVPAVAPSPSPVQSAALQPAPAVSVPRTTGNQNTLLPKAVLTSLPYDWRYQIPDAAKRALRVSWPKNVPWREAIRSMATEAGCTAQFDESARRVTLTADTRSAPVTSTASASAPGVQVSALHPASLPEASGTTITAPAPQAKVEPKVIQDALAGATPVSSVSTAKVAAPSTPSEVVEQEQLPTTSVIDFTPPVPAASWVITSGPLKKQMETWAEQAGYQAIWKSNYDYMMQASSTFSGDFIAAVTDFFEQLHLGGNSGVRVIIHQDNKIMEVRHE